MSYIEKAATIRLVLCDEYKDDLLHHLADNAQRLSSKNNKSHLVYDEIRIDSDPHDAEHDAINIAFYREGRQMVATSSPYIKRREQGLVITNLDGIVPFSWE